MAAMLKVLLPLIGALAAQTLSPTQLDLAAGVAAGVAALSARLEAVEARLARYEGGASAAAAVAGPTPTTPATRRPLKVAPTSSKAGDLPGMELHNSVRTSCPYVRFSYHCKGPRLPAYAAEHARSLTSTLAAARGFAAGKSTGAKNVVFLGNSHTGQLGETLLCALHHLGEVAMFEGTDLNTGCLMKQRLNATCNGSGKPNACGMYIAKVVTKRNTTIYVLNNHPWLFQGAAGWNALTEHVGIDWAAVGKVVLGPSNAMSWTTFFSSPPRRGVPTAAGRHEMLGQARCHCRGSGQRQQRHGLAGADGLPGVGDPGAPHVAPRALPMAPPEPQVSFHYQGPRVHRCLLLRWRLRPPQQPAPVPRRLPSAGD